IEDKYYIPDRPQGINKEYQFKGWYEDIDGNGNPYIFTNKTMPEHNLPLYAKWAPPTYKVLYFESQDSQGDPKTYTHELEDGKYTAEIAYGDKIDEANLSRVTPEGLDKDKDFKAWYWYLEDTFVPFNFNTPIIMDSKVNKDPVSYEGYVLIPIWKNIKYGVT